MWKSEGNAVVKKVLEAQLARQEFAHAYLFLGEGVNTYALALAFAHKIRGKQSGNNDSDIFTLSVSEDFGVAETRELINRLSVRPLSGKHKVGIVDNAHMLNTQSANALLKTIEEPSSSTIIMLVARNRSLPSTILSRCQIFTCYWPTAPSTTNAEEVKNYIAEFNEIRTSSFGRRMLAVQAMAAEDVESLRQRFHVWINHVLRFSELSLQDRVLMVRALSEAEARMYTNVNKKLILERLFLAIP